MDISRTRAKMKIMILERLCRFKKMIRDIREGHGSMFRAWRSADVAACRAVSNSAWCEIFREISCFSPLNLGTLLRCCLLGQSTSPSNASLDSGENVYLVVKR